jgi:hypothetical protein
MHFTAMPGASFSRVELCRAAIGTAENGDARICVGAPRRSREHPRCRGPRSRATLCFVALLLFGPGVAGSEVRLLSWDSRSFRVETGSFVAWYDSSSTFGAMLIGRAEGGTVALANLLLGGSNLEPLQPDACPRIQVTDSEAAVRITVSSTRPWGELRSVIEFVKGAPGMVHWRVEAKAAGDFSPWRQRRSIFLCDVASGSSVSGSVEVYARQAPWAAGIAYFGEKRHLGGSVLFFENFTSLNRYFELVHGAPGDAIYLSSNQLGFVRPVNAQVLLPRGEWIPLEDGYLVLEAGLPQDPAELGLRFLRGLSWILQTVERPWASFQVDWLPIAMQTVKDLGDPACWVDLGGWRYLRAYVDVPRFTSAEAIAQLDVLCPLTALEGALGNRSLSDFDDLYLIPTLVTFLQPSYRVFVNDYPPYGVTGSNGWYQLQLLIDLAELARNGGPAADIAKMLLSQSLPTVIGLARANGYRFYESFRYSDYQASGNLEPDATGGYAYLMIDAHDIFGDSLYEAEARNALLALPLERGFDFAYEAHFCAITAAACARMANRTGDPSYVELAYLPLAALFRLVWWWECDYGYARHYQTFGGLSPMIGAGVITPKEQYEAWWYLREFLRFLPKGVSLPDEVAWLVSLFIEETPRVAYYCLPPHLPREAVWDQPSIYNSVNHPELMIPLEDLRQGWEQSGQIGQEIYGAGMSLAFAAATVASGVEGDERIPPQGVKLDIWPNPTNSGFRLRVTGPPGFRAEVRILDVRGRSVCPPFSVETNRTSGLSEVADLALVPSGLYLIQAEVAGKRVQGKVVLLR